MKPGQHKIKRVKVHYGQANGYGWVHDPFSDQLPVSKYDLKKARQREKYKDEKGND
jgi:hypothetical protein